MKTIMTLMSNGHKIEVANSLTGTEVILYDGKEVSNKRSVTGSTHIFQVTENDENVQYEVAIGIKMGFFSSKVWCEIRRKGEIIYTSR